MSAPAPGAQRAPLAREFLAAAHAVHLLEQGRRLPEGIDEAARRFALRGPSRAALQDLAFGCVRALGSSKALAALLNRRPPAPTLAALQWLAISQLTGAAPGRAPRADAVVVDQAVQAARESAGPAAGSFMNATLRRLLRERESLQARTAADPVARWNYPAWWLQQLQADHPAQWREIAEAGNRRAPLTLRVNVRRVEPDRFVERLQADGWPVQAVQGEAVMLARSTDVALLPGYRDGWFSVQDAGAQRAAELLQPLAGQRILDACAAPGGKTAHLLERADCDVLALDVDAGRIAKVGENLDRLGLSAEVRVADAGDPGSWWDGRPFDAILLDAPCSASGIVRRHPDIRWLRRRRDLATLCAQQQRLLAALWPLLVPGGKLLYATCSVFRAEGEDVIRQFLRQHDQARSVPLGGGRWPDETGEALRQRGTDLPSVQANPGWQLLPGASEDAAREPSALSNHDGFYYCLLQKSP